MTESLPPAPGSVPTEWASAPQLSSWTGTLLALISGAALALVTFPFSLERQRLGLGDWSFDLAFFHSLIAHASVGEGFTQTASTHEAAGLLGLSHAFWMLPAYVPLYRQVPRLELLFVLQGLTLGALGLALERLLVRLGVLGWERLLLVWAVLTAPSVVRLAVSDFNPLYLALPLTLSLHTALLSGRTLPLMLVTLALACVREELPILIGLQVSLAWGLGRLGWGHPKVSGRLSLLSLGLALGVYLSQLKLRPHLGYYLPLDRPLALLLSLDVVPGPPLGQRVQALLAYLPPISVLSLLTPGLWAVALPLLAWLFLRSGYEWWHLAGPYVHHPALLTGVAILSSALGAAWISRRCSTQSVGRGRRRLVWLAGLLLLGWQVEGAYQVLQQVTGSGAPPHEVAERSRQAQAVHALLARIPPHAPVAADYRFIAWLSGARVLYCYQSAFALTSQQTPEGQLLPGLNLVDWLLLDEAHVDWLERLTAHPSWRLEAQAPGYQLFRRVSPESSRLELPR